MLHPCGITSLSYFHCALEFTTQILAYMLDSLVRVSRRVAEDHFDNILDAGVAMNRPMTHSLQSVTCAANHTPKGQFTTPKSVAVLSQLAGISDGL
jgi:hypothetical protein